MNNKVIIEDIQDNLAIAVRCLKKAREEANRLQKASTLRGDLFPKEIADVKETLNKIDINSLISAQLGIEIYLDKVKEQEKSMKVEYEKSKALLKECLKKAREKGDMKSIAFFVMMQELSDAIDKVNED